MSAAKTAFLSRWRVVDRYSDNFYLMCRTEDGIVRYAPLCIHSFRLIAPRRLLEAQLFNQQYSSYEDIFNVPDRLRWCRHHMGLMQKEVAALIGISRAQYVGYELGNIDYFPRDIVDKLAKLFTIPVYDLLDDYNRFLYEGQGKSIKTLRLRLGHKKCHFAKQLNLDHDTLSDWENELKQISKNSWIKYFKDLIKP